MIELALILAVGVLGLAFAAYLARWVLACPTGENGIPRVAALIRAAAEGFYRRLSSLTAAVSAVLGGAIFLAYGLLRRSGEGDPVPALELGVWLTISFALGAACSVAAGHVGTWISTRTGARAAIGATRSLDQALQIALRGGAVSGVFISAISVLGVGGLFTAVLAYKGVFGANPTAAFKLAPIVPLMIIGFPLGASFAAFLTQLGAGTFSKAADLGADLGGREAGLLEDDLQNPAAIVDLAGDTIGSGAGRGASVFEAAVAENLGAMIVGAMLFRDNKAITSALSVVLFPLVTRAFGLLASMFGVMVVKTDDREDPFDALARGLYVTALLHAVGVAGASKWLLGRHWLHFFACGAIGIAASVAFLHATQYYTEQRYRPVRELADAARGGPAMAVLRGMVTGLESALAPFVVVIVASFAAFFVGARTGLTGGGLFGMGVATMGMLGMSGYLLALEAFGPIVDNAGGIVEMTIARERPDVRGRTNMLDSVGNTVKAVSKAHAAGAAALASLLLVAAYVDEVRRRFTELGHRPEVAALRLDRPELYLGALVGILLVFWLAATSIESVVRVARRLIDEVRRQVGASVGASVGAGAHAQGAVGVRASGFTPDHAACIEMVSRAALRRMIAPALIAVGAPILVGLALRFVRTEDNPLVAADSVAALIMAATVAGVLGSLLLGNAGSAWDNAKKYIMTGAHGGRFIADETGARADNPTYLAAVVGDSVGDPLKDAAGPAIYVLIKMLPVVTIVFLPFFI